MKVLLINNLYGRHARGGAERVVDGVIEGLRALGHESVVLTAGEFEGVRSLWARVDALERASTSSANNKISPERSRRVYRFFPLNLFSIVTINKPPKWLRTIWHVIDAVNDHPAWVLYRIIECEKPDIVWTHNLKGLGSWIPPLLRWRKIRHIHHLHDVQLFEPSGLLFPSHLESMRQKYSDVLKNIRIDQAVREGLRRLSTIWYRWSMGSPTLVISPTMWLLELHQQQGFFQNSKTRVLAHPTRSLGPTSPRLRWADAARDGTSAIKLLFAGQLVQHKGIEFLLDTIKFTALAFTWELHIAGTGALESTLREKYASDPRFIFHGKLLAQPFEDIWSQTDLTIVPSLCLENAPTVIVESFARGIPVLASRVGGIAEMVREGENGWLFLSGDCNDFIEKLSIAVQSIGEGFTPVHYTIEAPEHYTQSVLFEFLSHGSSS